LEAAYNSTAHYQIAAMKTVARSWRGVEPAVVAVAQTAWNWMYSVVRIVARIDADHNAADHIAADASWTSHVVAVACDVAVDIHDGAAAMDMTDDDADQDVHVPAAH